MRKETSRYFLEFIPAILPKRQRCSFCTLEHATPQKNDIYRDKTFLREIEIGNVLAIGA